MTDPLTPQALAFLKELGVKAEAERTCRLCGGSGETTNYPFCPACDGSGSIPRSPDEIEREIGERFPFGLIRRDGVWRPAKHDCYTSALFTGRYQPLDKLLAHFRKLNGQEEI